MQPGTIIDLGSPISGSRHGKYIREYDRDERTHICEIELLSARTPGKTVGIVRLVNWGTVNEANNPPHVATHNKKEVSHLNHKRNKYGRTSECCCGCSKRTAGGNFLPGHDSKAKSILRKEVLPLPQILIDFIRKTPRWKDQYEHLI